ncbi:MAG: hypothetical protein KF754_03900 [Planctomycetes bacterium]|nr:hypothetical protein [Planctomycetota bacterium]
MPKWTAAVLFALMLLVCGCVERRIYLISDPPGADVFIDGEYVGQTRPKDHPDGALYANFIYYGKREYTFRKPGFATQSGEVKLEAPWYEYPPIDFFAEVLLPWPVVDNHYVNVKLERAKPADVEDLYRAAQAYRTTSRPEDRFEYAQRNFLIIKPRPIQPPKE